MKKLKVFLGLFVCAFMVVPFMGVKAAENYTENDINALLTPGGKMTLNEDDTLTVKGTKLIGSDGYFDIDSGKITFENVNGRVSMTVDGTVISRSLKNLMFFNYGGVNVPIDLTVNEGATLNISGNMALTTGTPVTLTNNGTVNIEGILEVRSGSTYTGSGVTNLYGTLAIYGAEGGNLTDSKITLFDKANVYSESDVTSNLVIGEADTDEYKWSIGENGKSYVSISPDVSNNFGFGYTLTKTMVPAEETEPEEEVKDEVENPKTSDGIMIVVSALAASAVVAIIAKKKLA